MDEFNEGDVVVFKGYNKPRMVISNLQERADGPTRVTCVWFDDVKQCHTALFNVAVLVKRSD